jgi:hypothetical protein
MQQAGSRPKSSVWRRRKKLMLWFSLELEFLECEEISSTKRKEGGG